MQGGFGGVWRGEGAEGVAGCADGWVPGEGEFGVGHEDAGAPGGGGGVGGDGVIVRTVVVAGAGALHGSGGRVMIVVIVVEVDEGCFGEVEFARDGLEGFGGGVLVCGDEDEGEGVAFEFRLGLLVFEEVG